MRIRQHHLQQVLVSGNDKVRSEFASSEYHIEPLGSRNRLAASVGTALSYHTGKWEIRAVTSYVNLLGERGVRRITYTYTSASTPAGEMYFLRSRLAAWTLSAAVCYRPNLRVLRNKLNEGGQQ
ncbi:MAG: hypothetical protein H7330_16265 [Hymenobacteraceae bacterium]|nr:hypothetical protein [Hymenobacteraceae bacterium]